MSQVEKDKFNKLDPWEIIAQHDEINNRWLRIRNVTFRLPNGQELKDYYIAEKPPVAVVIPLNSEGKTFLIKEYERGVAEIGHKFPAGRVNQEESPIQAAEREFQEEIGMKAGKLIYLGERYVEPGFMSTRAHYFLGLDLQEVSEGKIENPFELFEGEWIDLGSIESMIGSGEIKNPFVIVGYTLALMKLKELGLA